MPEQITYYRDEGKLSPFCHRVEIALLEAGASYTSHGFDIYNKPAWFARVNPLTGKIPAITYGGPHVPPEEPSTESFKITESVIILEFLADVFPNAGLLPPTSDPAARARVRFFVDVVREVERLMSDMRDNVPGAREKVFERLDKIQTLLPDADAGAGEEYAIGKAFTIADCTIAPLLVIFDVAIKTGLGNFESQTAAEFGEMLAAPRFERLRRYKMALLERESVKKVVDPEAMEVAWRARFAK